MGFQVVRQTNILFSWRGTASRATSCQGMGIRVVSLPFLFPRRNDMGVLEKPVLLLSDFSTTDIEKE